MAAELRNPILPGFYPDPSICRKGEDYYLVTSTFEYFPGVPVFHSRDLIHWHQIGHCLHRPEQVDLSSLQCSKGIYAASIHYHPQRDLFYMITTLVSNGPYLDNVNFYVTATNPAGPWSNPVVIKGAEGIDPSLFFDEDGKSYYIGNMRPDPWLPPNGKRHIWLQEIDLANGTLLGDRYILRTEGAVAGAKCPEGPHLYRLNGWYYLMIAEGGTELNHSETIFRSRCITGPYEPNPRNPLITHRHLGLTALFNSTGHADLIQTHTGEWWAVLLACRPTGGMKRGNLGRETCMLPVIWEEGWPVFSPGSGRLEESYPAPALSSCRWDELSACSQFDSTELPLCYVSPRTGEGLYSLTARPGWLRLYLKYGTLKDCSCVSYIARRQQHNHFAASTKMHFVPTKEGESAGIAVYLSTQAYLSMEYTLKNGQPVLQLMRCDGENNEQLAQVICSATLIWLKVVAHEQAYSFYYAVQPEVWKPLYEYADGSMLSLTRSCSFTGTMVGMYATGKGKKSAAYADYDWFEYREIDP